MCRMPRKPSTAKAVKRDVPQRKAAVSAEEATKSVLNPPAPAAKPAAKPKAPKVKKPKVKVTRKYKPTYAKMIRKALDALNEGRSGSSVPAILKYLKQKYPVPENFGRFVRIALASGVQVCVVRVLLFAFAFAFAFVRVRVRACILLVLSLPSCCLFACHVCSFHLSYYCYCTLLILFVRMVTLSKCVPRIALHQKEERIWVEERQRKVGTPHVPSAQMLTERVTLTDILANTYSTFLQYSKAQPIQDSQKGRSS